MRILFVRTDRIGDVVLTTPAVSLLRKKHPDAHIAFLASSYAADVLAENPDIDEIIVLKSFGETLREIKKRKFDACVLFFVDFRAALLARLSGIPFSVGPASKIWSVFLSQMIRQRRSKTPGHEADFNTALLAPLGVEPAPAKPVVVVSPQEKAEAAKYLSSEHGISASDLLICLHPGSKGSSPGWPENHYSKLAGLLAQTPGAKILLTGGPGEEKLLERISGSANPKPAFMKKPLGLRGFISVLSLARLVVSNSTGPLHVAAACGVATVSFFPRLKGCLPERWGPLGERNIVLTPEGGCMEEITPQAAFEAAKKLLCE